jgi:RHS repeat-associated protein
LRQAHLPNDYYYDLDGNVIQKYNINGLYNRQWYWNARGQLDSALKDSWYRTSFDYNALGKPVRIWDGDPNGRQTDLPFAHTLGATTPTGIRYHEVDGLGNVIGTSQSGSASQTITYDVWGATTYAGNADQHLVWKGLFWNGDFSGLIFMRNRWYDPKGGRFVNEDPAGFHGGVNLYAFAGNDPINGSDPYGEWCFRQRVLGVKISVGYCNGLHSSGPISHKLPPRAPVVAVSHQTAGLGDCLKNRRIIIACASYE